MLYPQRLHPGGLPSGSSPAPPTADGGNADIHLSELSSELWFPADSLGLQNARFYCSRSESHFKNLLSQQKSWLEARLCEILRGPHWKPPSLLPKLPPHPAGARVWTRRGRVSTSPAQGWCPDRAPRSSPWRLPLSCLFSALRLNTRQRTPARTWLQSSGQGTVDQGGPGAGESTVTGTGPPDLLSPQTPPPLQWLGRPLCLHGERGACPMRSRFYLPRYSSPSQVIKQLKILTEQPDHRWKHFCVLCGKSKLRKHNRALKGQAKVHQSLPSCAFSWACSSGRRHLITALSSIPVRSLAPVTSGSMVPAVYGRSSFSNLEGSPFWSHLSHLKMLWIPNAPRPPREDDAFYWDSYSSAS